MTNNDYEKTISSILEIITKNADKLRVPTSEEERKGNKRMLYLVLWGIGVMLLMLLCYILSQYFSPPWLRLAITVATLLAQITFASLVLWAVLPDIWRARKEFTEPVQSQIGTLVTTLRSESEVVAELLTHERSALILTADRLDYEAAKVAALVSVLINTKSINLVAVVVGGYVVFKLLNGTGLFQLGMASGGALFVMTLYFVALRTKHMLGVFEYRGKFVRMVANMKQSETKLGA